MLCDNELDLTANFLMVQESLSQNTTKEIVANFDNITNNKHSPKNIIKDLCNLLLPLF